MRRLAGLGSATCVLVGFSLAACEASRQSAPPDTTPASASSTATAASASATASGSTTGSATATATATASASAAAPVSAPLATGGKHAVTGKFGLVTSESPLAAEAGAAVLAQGGNAIDAAVVTGYVLAVTQPVAGSLGGGGFMVISPVGKPVRVVDFREIAPKGATVALNERQLAAGAHGYLSAPVPGIPHGYNYALRTYGSWDRARALAPAIALAKEHKFETRPAQVLAWFWNRVRKDVTLRKALGAGSGKNKPLLAGRKLRQPELAATLQRIVEQGDAGFYGGETAKKIAKAMKARGGLVTVDDLTKHQVIERQPLAFTYRGYQVATTPPPSMGGIAVASLLLGLQAQGPPVADPTSAGALHRFIEVSKRAYADRRSVGADPDFVPKELWTARLQLLLDPAYYRRRAPQWSPERATDPKGITPLSEAMPAKKESDETTHFSVVDRHGNMVSCTVTLSAAFGAHVMVPGTGVILSNAMGAFSPDGLNTVAPYKRMATSMAPTIVSRAGIAVAAVGSPGGDTIPNTIGQVLRNLLASHLTVDRAVETLRVHHQFRPNKVRLEKKRPPSGAVLSKLRGLGHRLELNPIPMGDANILVFDPSAHVAYGYADPRKGGKAVGVDSLRQAASK